VQALRHICSVKLDGWTGRQGLHYMG
jgi:hypothetical protein